MAVTFKIIFKAKTIILRLLKSVTKSYSYRVMASSWGGVGEDEAAGRVVLGVGPRTVHYMTYVPLHCSVYHNPAHLCTSRCLNAITLVKRTRSPFISH